MIRYCIWDVGKTIYDYSLEPLERWIAARTADPENSGSAAACGHMILILICWEN